MVINTISKDKLVGKVFLLIDTDRSPVEFDTQDGLDTHLMCRRIVNDEQEKQTKLVKIKAAPKAPYNEMHFYALPWPSELLTELGEVAVTLRVTLSYYIEPSPGEIGWKDKYRYQSLGLRFDINNSQESQEQFKHRINRFISESEESTDDIDIIENDSARWTVGINNRSVGSIHTDMITTTAADLASCNLIAVFPVIGWWKLRGNLQKYNNRARYSLIVSLDTPTTEVDLYNVVQTKIANIIQTPVEINIPV